MLLCYQTDIDAAKERTTHDDLSELVALHDQLREAGVLLDVQCLRSTTSATSMRVRGEVTEITDGPFATTKEMLAGYYVVRCADLDAALALAERLPSARTGTLEVRPLDSFAERLAASAEAIREA